MKHETELALEVAEHDHELSGRAVDKAKFALIEALADHAIGDRITIDKGYSYRGKSMIVGRRSYRVWCNKRRIYYHGQIFKKDGSLSVNHGEEWQELDK